MRATRSATVGGRLCSGHRTGFTMRRRRRAAVRLGIGAAGVLLVVVSPAFGRAESTGNYRPALPPDALTNGCYPLVDGIVLDFPYQVRRDGDDGRRRELVLQWDELSRDELVAALGRSLTAAGYVPDGELAWSRGEHRVVASVTELRDLPADAIVRGTLVLTLPATPLASADEVCDNPYSTKRFPPEAEEW